jgi:hypothetical protein
MIPGGETVPYCPQPLARLQRYTLQKNRLSLHPSTLGIEFCSLLEFGTFPLAFSEIVSCQICPLLGTLAVSPEIDLSVKHKCSDEIYWWSFQFEKTWSLLG